MAGGGCWCDGASANIRGAILFWEIPALGEQAKPAGGWRWCPGTRGALPAPFLQPSGPVLGLWGSMLFIPELARFHFVSVTLLQLQAQLGLPCRHAPRERFENPYVHTAGSRQTLWKSRATPELLLCLCTAKVVLPPTARSPQTLWKWHIFSLRDPRELAPACSACSPSRWGGEGCGQGQHAWDTPCLTASRWGWKGRKAGRSEATLGPALVKPPEKSLFWDNA